MAAIIELTNHEWSSVGDLFDPTGRRRIPARYPRRSMVEAILFLARTGIPNQPDQRGRVSACHGRGESGPVYEGLRLA